MRKNNHITLVFQKPRVANKMSVIIQISKKVAQAFFRGVIKKKSNLFIY